MAGRVELFYWHVPDSGYEWVSGKSMKQLQATDPFAQQETRFLAIKSREKQLHTRYNPLASEPLLFRTFARTEPSEAGFLDFANRFGNLGVGLMITRDDAQQKTPKGGLHVVVFPFTRYDPYYRWLQAHRKMREIDDVLTAIQARDMETLRKWFSIVQDGGKYSRSDEAVQHWSWVTVANESREYLWEWMISAKSDDEAILRLAQGWAQHEINSSVSEDGSPSTVRVVFDVDAEKMGLHICPSNLLAAMWFQCARVLALEPTFRSCDHCGKWFELSAEKRRRHSKYCGDRCKVAAYRVRKQASASPLPSVPPLPS